MATQWKITYKQNGKENVNYSESKLTIIEEYLSILREPFTENISELKVWKNDIDYTYTLNKFLGTFRAALKSF